MKSYILLAVFLRFAVSFLLLLGSNRMCAGNGSTVRLLIAAAMIGLYCFICLMPQFGFLGNRIWYIVFLILAGLIAFGMVRRAVRPVCVFLLMNLILDSISAKYTDVLTGLISAAGLILLCFIGFRDPGSGLVPVQLNHNGKSVSLTALRDTGNTLTDPITGRPVLVVGAQVAGKLTGLTAHQLQNPVDTLPLIPGLRLIPYSTVGQTGSFMLAMRLQEVKIGSWHGSGLVAFAPYPLGTKGNYQALTGGTL